MKEKLVISSDLFSYHKDTKTLSVEASTLCANGASFNTELTIKSTKTDRCVTFELSKLLRTDDEDNEIYGWEFKPVNANDVNVKVVVWND